MKRLRLLAGGNMARAKIEKKTLMPTDWRKWAEQMHEAVRSDCTGEYGSNDYWFIGDTEVKLENVKPKEPKLSSSEIRGGCFFPHPRWQPIPAWQVISVRGSRFCLLIVLLSVELVNVQIKIVIFKVLCSRQWSGWSQVILTIRVIIWLAQSLHCFQLLFSPWWYQIISWMKQAILLQ